MNKKTLYTIYNLPIVYAEIGYEDTALIKVKQEHIEELIPKAPYSGTLTIQGTAAPVVNQLMEQRSVRGIDFNVRSEDPWGTHQNPSADVVVLYNVGSEVAMKGTVGGLVLANIVKYYSNRRTLLVIETNMNKMELLHRYDFKATNFIKIEKKPEDVWI